MLHIRNEDSMEFKRVRVYISFDGMCLRLWLAPDDGNADKFNDMLLDGLETIHNRAGREDDSITWDLVFTPGGRVSVEMIAGAGGQRVAMSPMKQAKGSLVGAAGFRGMPQEAVARDLNISYEKML